VCLGEELLLTRLTDLGFDMFRNDFTVSIVIQKRVFGTKVSEPNLNREEIKSRIISANFCYHSVHKFQY
jgi:hypothetical protein